MPDIESDVGVDIDEEILDAIYAGQINRDSDASYKAWETRKRGQREAIAARLGEPIRYNPTETVIVYDKAGNELNRMAGNESSVAVGAEQYRSLKDNAWVHNHPNDSSFSQGDVYVAIKANSPEITAIGGAYTHRLERPPGGWPTKETFVALRERYEYPAKGLIERYEIENERLPDIAANTIFSHTVNVAVANAMGAYYSRTLTGEAPPHDRNYGGLVDSMLADPFLRDPPSERWAGWQLGSQDTAAMLSRSLDEVLTRDSEASHKAWETRKRKKAEAEAAPATPDVLDPKWRGQMIAQIGDPMRDRKTERLVGYNASGVVFSKSGSKDRVIIRGAEEIRAIAGSAMLHNHPNDTSLSHNDIDAAAGLRAPEATVVTTNRTYRLYPVNGPTAWPSRGRMNDVHTRIEAQETLKAGARLEAGEPYDKVNIEFSETKMMRFAEEFSGELVYEVTETPGATRSLVGRDSEASHKAWETRRRGKHAATIDRLGAPLRDRATETMVAFDDKGNVVHMKSDDHPSRVTINASDYDKMRGNGWVHNHPGGTSISGDDILVAATGNSPVMAAVGQEYTYTMTRPEGGWPPLPQIADTYNEYNSLAVAKINAAIDRGEISQTQRRWGSSPAEVAHRHIVAAATAAAIGATYERRPTPGGEPRGFSPEHERDLRAFEDKMLNDPDFRLDKATGKIVIVDKV